MVLVLAITIVYLLALLPVVLVLFAASERAKSEEKEG